MRRKINENATIGNIVKRCNSNIGYCINMEKFNKEPKTDKFLIECAKFVRAEVVYISDCIDE